MAAFLVICSNTVSCHMIRVECYVPRRLKHLARRLITVLVIWDYFNRVAVGIKHESDVLHTSVRKSLSPVTLEILKTLACSLNVVNTHACSPVSAYSLGCSLRCITSSGMIWTYRCGQSLGVHRCRCDT